MRIEVNGVWSLTGLGLSIVSPGRVDLGCVVAWDGKFALGATKGSVIRVLTNNTYMLFVALIPGPIVAYLAMRYGRGRDEGH